MKKSITAIASCLMLLAYFALPYFKLGTYVSDSMLDLMDEREVPIMVIVTSLLLLVSPLYLLLYAFRDKLGRRISIVGRRAIPEKAALTLPLILFICLTLLIESTLWGEAEAKGTYGPAFYLYLLAAIAAAAMTQVKHPKTERKAKAKK